MCRFPLTDAACSPSEFTDGAVNLVLKKVAGGIGLRTLRSLIASATQLIPDFRTVVAFQAWYIAAAALITKETSYLSLPREFCDN